MPAAQSRRRERSQAIEAAARNIEDGAIVTYRYRELTSTGPRKVCKLPARADVALNGAG
jgi:hypothetical protein